MFSLNVPLSGRVRREIESVRPALADFDVVRDEPTLVVKRFGHLDQSGAARIESEVRAALAGAPAFEARLDGPGAFEAPPAGPAPVVYFAVESPGLEQLHDRLIETFGAVEGLEGEDYVPHITVARGLPESGDASDALARIADLEVEPVAWSVSELWFWDARRAERVGRVALPG